MEKLIKVFKIKELRNKILMVFGMLVVFRLMASIPVPGIDIEKVKDFFSSNQLFGMLNVFSGGGMANFSIVMLGVGPYITSSIIMQLMTMVIPQVEKWYREEGEAGRQKLGRYEFPPYFSSRFIRRQSGGSVRLQYGELC